MDFQRMMERLPEQIKKYRYALLVVLSGILLMTLPGKPKKQEPMAEPEPTVPVEIGLQEQLETILSQVSGAGRVRVLLTEATGEEILYQTNEELSTQSGSSHQQTVTVKDAQRAENGLIRQINPPTYQGALVLCQGAEKASVRLAISEAVSSVTGLTFDRITVLKIK